MSKDRGRFYGNSVKPAFEGNSENFANIYGQTLQFFRLYVIMVVNHISIHQHRSDLEL